MSPNVIKGGERNPGIDALRGISIILVIVNHLSIRYPLYKTSISNVIPALILNILAHQGHGSVFIFFVISGFLITSNITKRENGLRSINLAEFYSRRFARIAPCLFLLVIILTILGYVRVDNFAINNPSQSLGGAAFSALGIHLNWYECLTGYLPANWDVLWSLSIEEAFYIAFPLFCLLLSRSEKVQFAAFSLFACSLPLIMFLMAASPTIWRHKAYTPGMAAISAGVAAAIVAPHLRTRPALVGWVGTTVLTTAVVVSSVSSVLTADYLMIFVTGGTAGALIAFSHGWGRRLAGRSSAWVRSFGMMSYEVYLTHMFAVFFIMWVYGASGLPFTSSWVAFPITLGLSWLIGYSVDRFFSYPADRWLRRAFRDVVRNPSVIRQTST
ncbi:acyltransferase family protein [Gluconacetobacter tumulicola]|uniref:Acyltransferase n=1 Tax=Gluconacetobacter tumulicola TaxID=1017177 RepID=A0A7W4JD71_9PROT|nr:acyltransferase [Gluconacetobacter tumulicola]